MLIRNDLKFKNKAYEMLLDLVVLILPPTLSLFVQPGTNRLADDYTCCLNQAPIDLLMTTRAAVRAGRSSGLGGYMLAQCAVPTVIYIHILHV